MPGPAGYGIEPEQITPPSAKVLLIVTVMLPAFFHFTRMLRYFKHACFLIDVPQQEGPDQIAAILPRATDRYTPGMRACYVAVPASPWTFASVSFLVTTVILASVLSRLDYA